MEYASSSFWHMTACTLCDSQCCQEARERLEGKMEAEIGCLWDERRRKMRRVFKHFEGTRVGLAELFLYTE